MFQHSKHLKLVVNSSFSCGNSLPLRTAGVKKLNFTHRAIKNNLENLELSGSNSHKLLNTTEQICEWSREIKHGIYSYESSLKLLYSVPLRWSFFTPCRAAPASPLPGEICRARQTPWLSLRLCVLQNSPEATLN